MTARSALVTFWTRRIGGSAWVSFARVRNHGAKRRLNLEMIRTISAAWAIPMALLAKPNALAAPRNERSGDRPLPLGPPTP
jgi:hypothetical protein